MNIEWKYVEATEVDPTWGTLGQLLAIEKSYWMLDLGLHTAFVYIDEAASHVASMLENM